MLLILSAIIIPILLSPQTATAIDVSTEKWKMVVQFELAGNPNIIRGSYQQDVAPDINTMFVDFGLNTFEKTGQGAPQNPYGYLSEIHVVAFQPVGSNPIMDNIYQIYPLVRITGDKPDLTQEDYDSDKNVVLALMRTEIVDFLEVEGAYNVETYVHFSWGTIIFDEGF